MARQAERPAVGRRIESASRARNDVVTFELFVAAAALAAPAIPTKYKGPQLTPTPRQAKPGTPQQPRPRYRVAGTGAPVRCLSIRRRT